jgi:hypothetical protein
MLLGGLCALTLAACAQSPIARVTVPFQFTAGGSMLPAGEYIVEFPDPTGLIVLRGSAGNSVTVLSIFSGAVPDTSTAKLIFERRDGMAYLSAVETPGQIAQVISAFKRVTKGVVAAAIH